MDKHLALVVWVALLAAAGCKEKVRPAKPPVVAKQETVKKSKAALSRRPKVAGRAGVRAWRPEPTRRLRPESAAPAPPIPPPARRLTNAKRREPLWRQRARNY